MQLGLRSPGASSYSEGFSFSADNYRWIQRLHQSVGYVQRPSIIMVWPLFTFPHWISMVLRVMSPWLSKDADMIDRAISIFLFVVSPGSLIHLLASDRRQRQEEANNCVNSDLTNGGWPIPTHHPLHTSSQTEQGGIVDIWLLRHLLALTIWSVWSALTVLIWWRSKQTGKLFFVLNVPEIVVKGII